jgi:ABC-2 type transport system ATP-binding protein
VRLPRPLPCPPRSKHPEGLTIGADSAPGPDAPTAIEARGLKKTFRIPTHRVDSLKERLVRPFASYDVRVLHALDDVSFDVRRGEFFGIVGRNGSGKSTLLKLLASIYRADGGSIRIAGRLAPFIELGVGFNQDLTARENVVLNGVMMGLTPREMQRRLAAVIEFAELEDFSVMLQADADVLLIDEVLAVGDASFQQKCADAFHRMKEQGKTIVLVTHEMSTVEAYCHRAMLIADGKVRHVGDPARVGREYLRLNFEQGSAGGDPILESSDEVRMVDAWIEGPNGKRLTNVEHGQRLRLRLRLEALRELAGISVGLSISNADGINVFEFGAVVEEGGELAPLSTGQQVEVTADVETLLTPGRYFVHCGINRAKAAGVALYVHNAVDFVVFGGDGHSRGVVSLPHEIEAVIAGGGSE